MIVWIDGKKQNHQLMFLKWKLFDLYFHIIGWAWLHHMGNSRQRRTHTDSVLDTAEF